MPTYCHYNSFSSSVVTVRFLQVFNLLYKKLENKHSTTKQMKAKHAQHAHEIRRAKRTMLLLGAFIDCPKVRKFENLKN